MDGGSMLGFSKAGRVVAEPEVPMLANDENMAIDIGLSALTPSQQEVFRQLADKLSGYVSTAYIFCFALHQHEVRGISCFEPKADREWLQADILLIYNDDEQRDAQRIRHLVNNVDLGRHQYAAMVLPCEEAMERLTAGDAFVCKVFRYGALLYSHRDVLPKRAGFVCYETLLQKTRAGWYRWFNNSCQFMDCAGYCLVEHKYNMAVFMIHQGVEQACKAMLKVMLHVSSNTHNLAWMLKLCSTLAPEISSVFPRDNPQEQALFNCLKRSYMDSRYAVGFSVSEEDALTLYYRASSLLRIAGRLCNTRIDEMERLVGVSKGVVD